MNNEVDVFESNQALSFKVDPTMKLMPHILEEYSHDVIRDMHDMYANDTTHSYGLKLVEGETITGKLVGETSSEYLFDIGYKDYLLVEKRNDENDALAMYADVESETIKLGTEVDILLTVVSEEPFLIKGSIYAIHRESILQEVANEEGLSIDAFVKTCLPAGFILEGNYRGEKVSAFMPNILAGVNKLSSDDSEALVGTTIEVMIETYTPEKGSFIVSRKRYLETLIPEAIESLETEDEDGNHYEFEGVVTGTNKFGVFVQLGECLTGMIHKSNLENPTSHFNYKSGDSIKCFVKDVMGTKLNLTQVIRETLWDTVEVGMIVEGVVKEYKSFGMLVQFDYETVGLVHNSELEKANIIINEKDRVKTRVLEVNKKGRKINLAIAK